MCKNAMTSVKQAAWQRQSTLTFSTSLLKVIEIIPAAICVSQSKMPEAVTCLISGSLCLICSLQYKDPYHTIGREGKGEE